MVKRFIMVTLALLTIGVQAFAQNVVTGKVVDAKGEPVVGAGVQVKGTTAGVVTDLDGNFSIKVADKATLVISSIGYKTAEVAASGRNLKVVLEEDALFLDDVVVVGYGTARKRDVSGAIASVNYGNDANVASLPNPNALAALSSKVAGLSYAPTSSASGDNTQTMTIRGKNAIPTGGSISNSAQAVNQPLLVIDGVLSYGSINSINTADIQSIDVLKDASAAAIYGSRAANGVIIITTKRGLSEKPTVSFNSSWSRSFWSRMPERVTDKETFLKNRFYSKQGAGTVAAFAGKTFEEYYTSIDAAAGDTNILSAREKEAWDDGQWVNWLDEISRKGVGQKYDVSIAGRSEKVSYYISGDYTRQQGIVKGDDYEKSGAMAKLDINLADWLTVGFKGNLLASNSWGQPASIRYAMWYTPLSYVYARQDGYTDWYNSTPDGSTGSPYLGAQKDDSYAYTDRSSKSINLNGVAYAQIDVPYVPGLSYKVTFQGQRNSGYSDVFNDPKMYVNTEDVAQMMNPGKFNKDVTGSSSASNYSAWNIDHIITYTKDIDLNHFDFTAGYTREKTVSNSLYLPFSGFDTPTTLKQYNLETANSYAGAYRRRVDSQAVGYLFRANYNFASKYYATFNFRRDGYSAFSVGNKWGNFFGASAAWVLSNEDFIKNIDAINFLKLRLSWGQNGSRSVTAGATLPVVEKLTSNNGNNTMTWLGNASNLGMAMSNVPNPDLTWATVEKLNLGIDYAVLDNRINGSIDVYSGATINMLVSRSAPYFSGYTNVNDNVGKVTNKGVEIVLNTVNVNGNGKDSFRWESNFVFDSNVNTLVTLFGPDYNGNEADDVANAVSYGRESNYALLVGHPIGSAYDYSVSIFQSQEEIDNYVNEAGVKYQGSAKPGDLKVEDWNKDGKISTDDRHFIGSPDPLFTLNFANTLSYKNFSLYFNFRWAQGDKTHFLWLDPYAYGTNMGGGAQLARVKPWTEENHSTVFPRYGYNNTGSGGLDYQFWNSRSFLKLKDLVFSYNIDQKLIKKVGLSAARVYVAATDLFTITNWSGIDPENAGTIAAGASSSRYGSSGAYKTVTCGVNLTF
ncbi:MAG: SusC/RagA family TonB-linked outer membrane protein [Bacteroidales bacterium]|nr:SusC/RagA family TonB-linked outer membrane protein [Bacteroidales bacterium]